MNSNPLSGTIKGLCAGLLAFSALHAANKKPNIIFHMDYTSVGDWGCYGGRQPLGAKTPNVDRFVAEGLKLTNCNAESQCTPSRSTLMNSRYSVWLVAHEMMHITDWFPTLLNLVGHPEKVPSYRVLDGLDQSAFINGKQDNPNRDGFLSLLC